MSQYDYAKDKRTDEQYLSDLELGMYNQKIVIDHYMAEKYYIKGEDCWDFEEIPDKVISQDWGEYTPDMIMIYKGKRVPCEVKVQMKPLREYIYVKQNQIDKLSKLGGVVLYATPRQYFIQSATMWSKRDLVADSPLNKPAYRMAVEKVRWTYWRYPITALKEY